MNRHLAPSTEAITKFFRAHPSHVAEHLLYAALRYLGVPSWPETPSGLDRAVQSLETFMTIPRQGTMTDIEAAVGRIVCAAAVIDFAIDAALSERTQARLSAIEASFKADPDQAGQTEAMRAQFSRLLNRRDLETAAHGWHQLRVGLLSQESLEAAEQQALVEVAADTWPQ